ncbi:MAG: KTSC domain-containing protein [Candidatus Saccharimonadaceae bacterium]
MICTRVSSSNLSVVCYDGESYTLDVTFHSNQTYRYSGVPQSVYSGLMAASSKGSYLNQRIKSQYPCYRIG